jgi:hypothetical protein
VRAVARGRSAWPFSSRAPNAQPLPAWPGGRPPRRHEGRRTKPRTDDPATAAGDWIAYEVDDNRGTAVTLLTDPTTPLSRIRRARVLWSALRAEGETAEERTMGSRLAIAAAAAALLFHGERITPHDDAALDAAMRSVVADEAVAAEIRTMVRMAQKKLGG